MRQRHRGIGLIEIMFSMLILSVMLMASMGLTSSVVRTRKAQAQWSRGQALAQQLMSEVLQARYKQAPRDSQVLQDGEGNSTVIAMDATPVTPVFGRETGEANTSRLQFDDVDDYDGWGGGPPQNKDGTPLNGYTGWQRQVHVTYVDPVTLAAVGTATDTGFKQITVTVTDPQGAQTVVSALRAASGVHEHEASIDTTVLTWIGVELLSGNGTEPVISGAHLVNPIPVPPP